jgi:CRP-like cAMP-binding protein
MDGDRRQMLRRVWLFAQLHDADLDAILLRAREQVCEAHTILFNQGDTSGDLFAVIQGRLKVATNLDGGEVLLSIIGSGEVFGEIALLDGEARSATVSAFETCRLMVMPRAAFRALLLAIPALGVRLLEIMAQRVRALTFRAEESLLLDVPTRLAKSILMLANRFGAPAGDGKTRVTIRLSQQELGNLIGATREMVNKCLARLCRQRVLRNRAGILTILDEERLRAAAEGEPPAAPRARRVRTPARARRAQTTARVRSPLPQAARR